MAKEFKAKEIDMDLRLETLDKEIVELSPRNKMSTDESLRIMTEWTKDNAEEAEGADKVNLLARELEVVYDKPAEWWSANFDIATLSDIVVFVAETIGGVQKKELSSN